MLAFRNNFMEVQHMSSAQDGETAKRCLYVTIGFMQHVKITRENIPSHPRVVTNLSFVMPSNKQNHQRPYGLKPGTLYSCISTKLNTYRQRGCLCP